MYGSFEEDESKNGSYVQAETEESLSAVKLIAINPNENDEEDAAPTTPMINNRPSSGGGEREGLEEAAAEGAIDKVKHSSISAIDTILTNFTGVGTADDKEVFEDESLSADVTLLQASSEGNITLVKSRIAALQEESKKLTSDLDKVKALVSKELDRLDEKDFSALHLASRYNRKNVIKALLDAGANIDLVGSEGLTPLHLATKYDMTSAAKFLLERGAQVGIKSDYGTTSLAFACRRGNIELVDLLMEKNPGLVDVGDNSDVMPLHAAMMGGKEDVVKALLDMGARIDAEDKEGEQPIHYAAADNNEALIALLAKEVASKYDQPEEGTFAKRRLVNSQTRECDTPLHIAAQGGYEEVAKTLIALGADVNARTDTNQTPLHLASIAGHLSILKLLIMYKSKINAKDLDQQTALHVAAQFGRLEVCKQLLEFGARLDCNDKDNFTPLMLAVWKGQDEIVQFLIDKGASVYVKDLGDKNVLHLAIEEDNDDTLILLFNTPAKRLINAPDKEFKTPLHYAAKVGNIEAIEMLLEKNADVDLTDNQERTPIHLAAENGQTRCVTALGEHTPGSVNYNEETGKSPLHLAAINGFKKTSNVLIEMGAETSSRDDVNWTPLDYAALHGHPKVVVILLENDAPVDAQDKKGSTPLHHASANGNTDCMSILLDKGAEISKTDEDGKNCLDLAVENGQVDACMALIQHKRWKEVLNTQDSNGTHPMEKLIAVAPTVAEIVLNKCIHQTQVVRDDGRTATKVTYNFEFLDIEPDKQVNKLYFAPSNMLRHHQEKLLAHKLTVKLISDKWSRLGHWIYVFSVFSYLLYLSLLTGLVIIDKQRYSSTTPRNMSQFAKVGPWFLLLISIFHISKELLQIYYLGYHYFKEMVNYLEIILYTATLFFILPFIVESLDQDKYYDNQKLWESMKWNAGSIAILLGWSNLLLYLKRFPFFGLYVVMFMEVFKSLISVLPLFTTFIIGFALSFYVLMDGETAFKHVGRAIMKTGVMTIGEFEFNGIMTEYYAKNGVRDKNVLPYPIITYLIFTLFLVLMPILTMNFLVGLAAGDIEAVRKNAYLRILRAQVHILKTIELSYPKWLLQRFYRDHVNEYIDTKLTFWERLRKWWKSSDYDFVIEEQTDAGENELKMINSLESNGVEIEKQKKKLKRLCEILDEQKERFDYLFEKFELED
ncbi:transient receptor potential cation channel subfamily A member 1-like isoform X2 [Clytia hemisphaerica]|uniref:Ion transport domain-containing protein n=1 Tax=Clytia hemisphaerica TaxID=252671 RepID=A0A7M5VC96_9CNID